VTDVKQLVERQMVTAGNTLLIAMETVGDDEFFHKQVTGFSAAWTVGHLACVPDLFSGWFGGHVLLNEQFHHMFNETDVVEAGALSKAESVDREFFPKKLLLYHYRQAMVKAIQILRSFDIEQWDAPPPLGVPVTLLTGGAVWERLAVHGDWHNGELAGSMPRFFDTHAMNPLPHHLYVPPRT
jgi:hypothetical protein